jgi:hypothetical protein
MRKLPKLSLSAVFTAPVPALVTVTFALGMTAFVLSITVPPIAPDVVDWANPATARTQISINMHNPRIGLVPDTSFMSLS